MYRIYVVEDHPTIRATLCETIEHEPDMTVCGTAASVAQATIEAAELAPDLLLVDLSLPDGTGYALIAHLRARQVHAPAIVLSGHPASQYRAQAERAGAAEYVDKLDASLTLVPTIRRVLGRERPEGS